MDNKMTVDSVLEETIKDLGTIQIPVELIEQIGFPIKRIIGNLNACIQAIRDARAKEEGKSEIDLTENVEEEQKANAE